MPHILKGHEYRCDEERENCAKRNMFQKKIGMAQIREMILHAVWYPMCPPYKEVKRNAYHCFTWWE